MKTVLLVNPFSSARYLSEQLEKHNIHTIALYTIEIKSDYVQSLSSCFDTQIYAIDANWETICEQLSVHTIDYVINGYEGSSELTERLIAHLTPQYITDIQNSHIKGNKYEQQVALHQNNLPAIKQVLVNCTDINLALFNNLTYPAFIKPVNGSGKIGAFLVKSKFELLERLENRPIKTLSESITHYLVQEQIIGEEIVVDSFSVNGKHYISEVFTYIKDPNNPLLTRGLESLTNSLLRTRAIDFATNCLNACKFKNGFSHMELFLLNDGSFRLIEINPRIHGAAGTGSKLAEYLMCATQCSLLINHVTIKPIELKKSEKFGRVVFLYRYQELNLEKYQSFKEDILLQTTPIKPDKTNIDLSDVRRFVILISDSQEIVEQEYKQLIDTDI